MKTPIIENDPKPFNSDTKRFYMPATVRIDCPKCAAPVTYNMRDNYFSYPKFNAPESLTLFCGHCDEETEVMLIIKLSLELAP